MKREHLQALVKTRVEQAAETLRDAEALREADGSARSVINRAYYAMFYATLALLQTLGEVPSKHTGVIALFDLHFFKTGRFSKEDSQALHELFDLRQFSDYRSMSPVSTEQALDALSKAQRFVTNAEQWLRANDFLSV